MNFHQEFLKALGEDNTPAPHNTHHHRDLKHSGLVQHLDEAFHDSRTIYVCDSGEGKPLELDWDPDLMGDEPLPLGWEDEVTDEDGDVHWNPTWKED